MLLPKLRPELEADGKYLSFLADVEAGKVVPTELYTNSILLLHTVRLPEHSPEPRYNNTRWRDMVQHRYHQHKISLITFLV